VNAAEAAARAEQAFATYRHASGKTKGALIRRIAENLEANGDEIVRTAHEESSLPIPRMQSELGRTTGQLRLFAALVEQGSWVDSRIDRADPDRKPPKPDLRSMLRPLGPVAVFGASNFPLAFSVAGGDTASALAAGCPVVVKAHPAHPRTSALASRAIADAAPDGVFAMIDGIDEGIRLVQHPAIKAVAFTGSRRGGRAIMDAVAQRPDPIPVYAEMGSVNPVFILPGALRERGAAIAAGLHASVTLGVGQFCTNPGLVIAQTHAPFLDELQQRIAATAAATMLTSGICDAYRAGVERLASTRGVRALARVEADSGAALFVTDARTFLGDETLMDEVFGPSTLVVESDDPLSIARRLEGQLTITIHGTDDDLRANRELIDVAETKAGRIVFNGFPTGVEVSAAMVHGGPWPATSDGRSTSVGTRAIERFTRAVCWQDCPEFLLPDELR